ncbi:CyP450 monooxygenase [Trametes gibbosa]|nr:CyP450 monooxygenase [Trametes gibbosa]
MIVWSSVVLLFLIIWRRRRSSHPPLPPGPPGLPVIGNALNFPTTNIVRRFRQVAVRYGKIFSFNVLGNSIIVLDSYDAASDLLEKRARIYSDRPHIVMANLSLLAEVNLPMVPNGRIWRQQRRIFHQNLPLNLISTHYRPRLERVTRGLLVNLLDAPEAFSRHVHHLVAASILSLGYGIEITSHDDHYVKMLHKALKLMEAASVPGKYLVELIPSLQYLPNWFPGTQFKRDAAYLEEETTHIKHLLYDHGKSLLESEIDEDCMLAFMLHRAAGLDGTAAKEEEEQSSNALLGTYMAGSDTTTASLRSFFLAMAMTPGVQKKAQAELDTVIGRSRLPNLDDRDSLPYIHAVIKELTRWNVVGPIGLPRRCLEDDIYDGYRIPKGSIVIANIWAFSRDPNYYPEPETFNPERFLKDGKCYSGTRDPYLYAFGFGRRVCPGRHLAEASMFLACASILHTFNISPPLDAHGHPVKLKARVETDLIIAHPKEFDCVVRPRFDGAADLIRAP